MRFITAAILTLSALAASADSIPATKVDYMPKIGGTIRARWEMQTDGGLNRFQLLNARVTLAGKIAAPIDYFMQADLCDCGSMKFLDGWVRMSLFRGFRVQAGQFRVPFGIDTFRGPGNYIFANRSFIGRYICNRRAVGVKASYAIPAVPVEVEAGVFDPGTIGDHKAWSHQKTWAAKAVASLGDFKVATGVVSDSPDSVRYNIADAAVVYSCGRWQAEAEYMYKHYTGRSHRATHAAHAWVDYAMPVRAGIFNQASFQGRFDVMTAGSDGRRDDTGLLYTNQPARRRITLGATMSRIAGTRHADLRLNYEKYFYNSGVSAPDGLGDKIVAELVLKF